MAGEDTIDSPMAPPVYTKPGVKKGGTTTQPTDIIKKSVSYVPFGDIAILGAVGSQKVLDLATSGTTYGATSVPNKIIVTNEGSVSIVASFVYEEYTGETTSAYPRALQTLIKPGESFEPPIQAVINKINATALDTQMLEGTAISNVAPDSNMYTNSTAATTEGFADDNDTTITFDDASGGVAYNIFRVNDLIRLDNEVVRITSIVDTAGDGAYTPAHFVVERGVHGTDKADHTNDTDIRFPFFNAYHDFDKYTVPQTDAGGKFKCSNFFGYGRTTSGACGITPSSVCLKFYEAGYQELGLSGVNSGAESGLAAETDYGFDITIDGSGLIDSDDLKFKTSTNTKWGGADGVIRTIQTILDSLYYTAVADSTGDMRGERVTVAIVDGDIRFTSGQHLSTSAILLAAPSGGELTPFGVGRMPAIGDVMAPVPAKLPDDILYDRITYATAPNSSLLSYDDGYGNLTGGLIDGGSINYETGAISFRGPSNAEFVITALYNSPFSGRIKSASITGIDQINALSAIYANTTSQKYDANIKIELY